MIKLLVLINQRGISLLEVQLSLAIFATSMLLIIKSYDHVGRGMTQAYQRQQAYLVMEQMLEVLPAYPPATLSHWVNHPTHALTVTNNLCTTVNTCNLSQSFGQWLQDWSTQVTQRLPQGRLTLACASACGSGTDLVITLHWSDAGSHQQASARVEPANSPSGDEPCSGRGCMRVLWRI